MEAAYAAKLTKCTSLLFFEDDLKQVKIWAILTAPVATKLICPDSCDAWLWNYKAQKYPGYHELAYLHPNHFKKIETDNKYNKKYLIRLAKLTAYHDKKNPGIDDALLEKIINKLEEYGDVVISGERGLPVKYQKYGKKIAPAEMLQFLANVDLYIGDSQTMAAEAAVLGVPSIRYNNFVGKLGYLEELEHKYKLTFGIRQGNTEELLKKIDDFLSITDVKNIWNKNRQIMLQQKIDVSKYIVDLVKQA